MSHDITEPLRLAVGSHQAGSGKGCAMNVISWENGDTTITDFPGCADRELAKLVQSVNDSICTHRTLATFSDGAPAVQSDLLCPECSVKVLDLGHRIVGTGTTAVGLERLRKAQFHIWEAWMTWKWDDPHPGATLAMAHRAIDKFNEITGRVESPAPDPAVVSAAIDNMRKVSA